MNKILIITITAILLLACRKEEKQISPDYFLRIQAGLQDSLDGKDFHKLDFDHAVLSAQRNKDAYVVRIPFFGKRFDQDFLIVNTTKEGVLQTGKIIHLEGEVVNYDWNGSITMQSLNRRNMFQSPIVKGRVLGLHPAPTARTSNLPDEGLMPEVIITYYRPSSGGMTRSNWILIQTFFDDTGFDFGGGYYISLEGPEGAGGGNGTNSDGYGSGNINDHIDPVDFGVPFVETPILVDMETQDEDPSIDLQKFLECFNRIPDAGATCSIEICTDIPVDSDPNRIMDFNTHSPGHVFIQIKKSNGDKSAIQNIGFYPKQGYKTTLTNAPIAGKWVDNGLHEFNASLKMKLSPEDFRSTLVEILYLKNQNYDIDNYNCTDWALDVFNKTRIPKLTIPLYHIPGNFPSVGTRMPQGLYNQLAQMKASNHPDAANISMGFVKAYVANSTGPCN